MSFELENNPAEGKYFKRDTEYNSNYDDVIRNTSNGKKQEEKVYTYDEAINLTGNGWYNISLLITLSLATQAIFLDMFGFTYVVAAAACDLQLAHNQTSFLLTVPLIGAITSGYAWGYFADTRGRKKSLIISLWGSYVVASLSSLSPNFTVLAVLKFFSSGLCGGAQSITYTLLGESCSARYKDGYVIIMISSLMFALAVYTGHAYIVLGINFTYDLGFIIFKPWRLLILTLATTLGASAVLLHFFYESPKFLVGAGRTAEAVKILTLIKERNGGCGSYEVKKIVLVEENPSVHKDVSFLRSLWEQTVPLFKPPLVQRALLLFYITSVIFSVNKGFFVWIPVMFSSIFEEASASSNNVTEGFCELIKSAYSYEKTDKCTSQVKLETLLITVIQGAIFTSINFGVARMVHRKKVVIICVSVVSSISCLGMNYSTDKITNIVLFFGVQANCYAMSMVFTYFIELFPTRHRGMITCLGMMVSRSSALVGAHVVGAFMFTHCTTSLYVWGAYMFSAALMASLLPPDRPHKS